MVSHSSNREGRAAVNGDGGYLTKGMFLRVECFSMALMRRIV